MIKRLFITSVCLILSACQDDSEHLALGTLERNHISINALVSETITDILVDEGDHVTKGQLLAKLDDRYAQTQVALAEAQLKQAQASLDEAQHGARSEQVASAYAAWQAAQASQIDAQRQYQRSQELFAVNAVGQAVLDNARALRDQTLAQANQSQQQWLELKNGTREEVLQRLQAQVDAAQAQLNAAQITLTRYRIIAPQDAVVDSAPWQSGDSVTTGAALFRLIKNGTPYARIYVPQAARTTLNQGEQVRINISGYTDPFVGIVRNIRSEPAYTPYYALNEKERARLVYLAEITLQNAEQVPTGTPLEAVLK
ncbi:HlyD family secretion protein [Marinomonas piezotolerans]|nr:HlyD family secretion protein [Marinomonas piezotolerans]